MKKMRSAPLRGRCFLDRAFMPGRLSGHYGYRRGMNAPPGEQRRVNPAVVVKPVVIEKDAISPVDGALFFSLGIYAWA
ncbi:MAG: hypothetical protein IAF02_13300 [Anaerolineae bacterium]|nr:hypothetical protein [Anaerolineae bacterium]